MRYLSVCSGIEAASVAWHPLGWTPFAFSEIEPFPAAVLAHHFTAPNLGDMTKFKDWPDADVDVLVGGTPCQSFSVAGLREGLDDPRGNLMLTYLAIAARYRPRWLVWENVPGVLSSNGGRDFGTFLGGLAELGYGFAYRVLDAQFVRVESHPGAVPQRRRRVFVVGCAGDWRRAAAVLLERESLLGHPAPRREAGGRPAAVAGIGAYGGGFGAESDVSPCLQASGGEDERGVRNPIVAPVAHSLTAGGFDASEDGTGSTPLVPVAFAHQAGGTKTTLGYDPDAKTAPTLAKSQTPAVTYTTKLHNTGSNNAGKIFKERTTCLDANSPPPALLTATQVRRLTPLECERLMGFPDGWTDVPYRGKPAADGPRYKALGNSMAVNVMRWIGERIQMAEAV